MILSILKRDAGCQVDIRLSRYNPGRIPGMDGYDPYPNETVYDVPHHRSQYVTTPACPACTAPGLIQVDKRELKCSYCGSSFNGIPLICPSCGWINNIEAEDCPNCGEPLSVIAQVIRRQDKDGGPQWMKRVQSQLGEMRSAEERASQLRLQTFHELDQQREDAIAEQKTRQAKSERTLFTLTATILLVMIVIIIIFTLFR
jgi:ssDNA-binding Zn-finger/Zn-ribbon topoisomerase 1